MLQNVPAVASSSYSSEMWSRVRGGTARLPPGHREDATNSGGQEEQLYNNVISISTISIFLEDWFLSFDVRNYGYRPLDRGYLLGPQIPVGQVSCDWWRAGHVTPELSSDWSRTRSASASGCGCPLMWPRCRTSAL